MSKGKRDSKGRFKKAVKQRRRRTRNGSEAASPAAERAENPRRRRRRRRGTKTAAVARRRTRNPGGALDRLNFPSIRQIGWGVAANLAIGFAVMRFGDKWGKGLFGQNAQSPYQGEAWSPRNYIVGGLTVLIGARLLRKWQGNDAARAFNDAGWAALINRFAYTEILAKSKWLQGTFGEMPGAAEIYDDGAGNRFLQTDNGYVALQGLVERGPMGNHPEYHGIRQPYALRGLVERDAYGEVADARDIDRSNLEGNLASHHGRKYYGAGDGRQMALYNAAWGQAY